ncbi:class I SAM-dependent methyltransferase [bacterium]|nr:class I SAM-dependent methyltransferase [bacterium]
MSKDYFQQKANAYEQDENRVKNVENIANAILNHFDFHNIKHIMDFGSGTGLLLENLARFVDKITAIDISTSMNKKLAEKSSAVTCELEILEIDLSEKPLDRKFDGIISSMTMHHISDIQKMFNNFYHMLHVNGFIAIADLELEDGDFHTDDTGVFHFGFEPKAFLNYAKEAGFKNLAFKSASIAHKPNGDYPIFLLTGIK